MEENQSMYIPKAVVNEFSKISHCVAILSGKGGVGKSFTTSYLAVLLQRKGYKVGILDADITGPSIPTAFNVKGPVYGNNNNFEPKKSKTGIQIMSSNLLLDNEDDPIVWRGAMISNLIEQFYVNVIWDCDFLLFDMPPGTGDIPLTIFQKVSLSSAVVVTSPQSLVSHVVEKSASMADMLSVPLVSLVNNMAYIKCPKCSKRIDLYGKGSDALALKHHIPAYDEIPFDSNISKYMDEGKIEDLNVDYLNNTLNAIIDVAKKDDERKEKLKVK